MFLSVYFNSIFVIINYFRYNKVVVAVLITGSFSNDDGDSNESVKKALVLLSKTTTNVKKKREFMVKVMLSVLSPLSMRNLPNKYVHSKGNEPLTTVAPANIYLWASLWVPADVLYIARSLYT